MKRPLDDDVFPAPGYKRINSYRIPLVYYGPHDNYARRQEILAAMKPIYFGPIDNPIRRRQILAQQRAKLYLATIRMQRKIRYRQAQRQYYKPGGRFYDYNARLLFRRYGYTQPKRTSKITSYFKK